MNENALWNSFKSGNQDAFTQIYKLHVKTMFRYGMSLVPASEDFVLDCIQDVFTELWEKRERVSTPISIKFYLLKSLKNRILHVLKRKEKPNIPLSVDAMEDLWFEEEEFSLKDEKEAHLSKELSVANTIRQLPPRQQEALRLRYIEDLDFEQVADILNVNRQSAQNLVQRALEKLRRLI